MKAGKLAIRPWLSCPYNKHTLVDLPSSVLYFEFDAMCSFDVQRDWPHGCLIVSASHHCLAKLACLLLFEYFGVLLSQKSSSDTNKVIRNWGLQTLFVKYGSLNTFISTDIHRTLDSSNIFQTTSKQTF